MNARSLFAVLLFFMPLLVFGQEASYRYSGKVEDAKGQPLEYATIAVYQGDKLIKGVSTSQEGRFSLELNTGSYQFKVTALGYKPLAERIIVKDKAINKTFRLEEDAKELAAVVVKSKRPRLERKVDRLVLNAEGLSAVASNAWELLKRAPGVVAKDGGGISLFGKGNILILENGRELRMDGQSLEAYLKSLKAEEVVSIEVMTTPPAKYAASQRGVINVQLRKRLSDYLGGSVGYRLFYRNVLGHSSNASAIYKKGMLSLNAYTYLGGGKNTWTGGITTETPTDNTPKRIVEIGKPGKGYRTIASGAGISLDLAKGWVVGGMFRYNGYRVDVTFPYLERIGQQQTRYHSEWMTNETTFMGGGYIEKNFDGGASLGLDLQYYRKGDEKESLYSGEDQVNFNEDAGKTTSQSYVAKLNYSQPLGSWRLLFGGQINYTEISSNHSYQNYRGLRDQQDKFIYKETLGAVYGDVQFPKMNIFSLKLGLRTEFTQTEGYSPLTKLSPKRQYIDLFPTLYASFDLSEKHQLGLESSIRITRPHFTVFNPFERYETLDMISKGNPKIQPMKSYAVTLKYSFAQSLFLDCSYEYHKNKLHLHRQYDVDRKVQVLQHTSMTQEHLKTFTLTYNKEVLPWLGINTWGMLMHIDAKDYAYQPAERLKYWTSLASANFSFYLDKARNLTAELSGRYQGEERYAKGKTWAHLGTGFSLAYKMLDRRLSLRAELLDFLVTDGRTTTNLDGRLIESRYYNTPSFLFYIDYRFGGNIRARKHSEADTFNRL